MSDAQAGRVAGDVHAIQTLKARYCRAADEAAHDPAAARAAFAGIFLPDAVGDYGVAPLVGGAAIAEYLCAAIAGGSLWALHMIHTPLIAIDGDRATGEWTVMTHLKRRAGGRVDVVIGRYGNVFQRTDAGWRIARVRFARLE